MRNERWQDIFFCLFAEKFMALQLFQVHLRRPKYLIRCPIHKPCLACFAGCARGAALSTLFSRASPGNCAGRWDVDGGQRMVVCWGATLLTLSLTLSDLAASLMRR